MDALLKANPRDLRGIAECMGGRTAVTSTAGPVLKVTFAQIMQYLAKERMTPARLETKFKSLK